MGHDGKGKLDTAADNIDKVNQVLEKVALLEPRVAALITGSILMVKGIAKLVKANAGPEAGPYIEEANRFADELAGLGEDIDDYDREFRPDLLNGT